MPHANRHHPQNKPPEIISYYTMRRAIGILGISLPLILWAGAFLFGGCREVQGSISTYYHTNMRNIFVGFNCAVALFLFAYRGHDWRDNLAGYLGCIFVLGVAFLPCNVSSVDQPCLIQPARQNLMVGQMHNLCALLYFIVLIVYALFLFPKTHMDMVTGEKIYMGQQKKRRNVVYYICGSIMTLSLIAILVYMWILDIRYPNLRRHVPIFWLETVMLLAFGISWLTKGQLFFKDPSYRKGP
jgi:heme A synthase